MFVPILYLRYYFFCYQFIIIAKRTAYFTIQAKRKGIALRTIYPETIPSLLFKILLM